MLDLSALFRSQGTRSFVTHYQEPSRRVPSTHEVDYRNSVLPRTRPGGLCANALHLHWQQTLVVDSHAPSSRSSSILNTYMSFIAQGLSPASPVHLTCGVVDAGTKACMPLRQSQMICLGESNLALRLWTIPRSYNSRRKTPGC
ncbi:unnamed protein product [Fusarium graminearum]|uniref:Uncharacterized protein n=1 Tax=Gibberella zeae TaxID=5518 RepID=A0A8H3Q4J0_GIBZA|nr:unnamed protein product [Fusarium graminearum]CAG1993080.1 unnamed protein product [Fusarium graminearum]CAG1995660.1 unnamed protein product [Fusarium graminearum]